MFRSPTYKYKCPAYTFKVEAETLGKMNSRFNMSERTDLFMQTIVNLFLINTQILRLQSYIFPINLQKFYTEWKK